MKAGTFDAYPPHSADPYRPRMLGSRDMGSASWTGKYFTPPAGPKSAPTTSVLDQNIVRLLTYCCYQWLCVRTEIKWGKRWMTSRAEGERGSRYRDDVWRRGREWKVSWRHARHICGKAWTGSRGW